MKQRDSDGAARWSLASLVCLLAVAVVGCSSKSTAGDGGDAGDVDAAATIFPRTFRQSGYQKVRACRAPGEHSALNGFTVWVNDAAAAAYEQILQSPRPENDAAAVGQRMPEGSVVVKELYRDQSCTVVDRWVAMKKITGFDPNHGDWFWQDVTAQATITIEGRAPSCSGCHEGRPDATCIGYGAVNGMDYLCTAP